MEESRQGRRRRRRRSVERKMWRGWREIGGRGGEDGWEEKGRVS